MSTNSFEDEEKRKLQELHNYDDSDLKQAVNNLGQSVDDLNLAQQELVDDMSKTYTGTNITAPTVAGLGRINKTYGKTTEVGTGEKSPTNPYTLKCVGDMVDLFDESNYKYVANALINSAGLISADASNYRIIYVEVKPNTEYVISFDVERSIVFNTTSVLPAIGVVGTPRQVATAREYTVTTDENAKYLCLRSDCRNNSSIQNYLNVGLKIQTKWKQGDKGTVETVSKNGSNTSSNIAYVDKPLCSIGDVRDELDYTNKKITRRCGKIVLNGTEIWQKHGSTANNVFYSAIFSNIKHVSNNNAIANMLSTHFEVKAVNNIAFNNTVAAGIDTQNTLLMGTSLNGISTVEAFKAWLASNPITVIYELATPVVEDIECLDKITQYNGQTTVYNRDGAEIEVSLTNNKAISEINENIKNVEKDVKTKTIDSLMNVGLGERCKIVGGDLNNCCGEATGFYMGVDLSNRPKGTAGWFYIIHLVHNSSYQYQLALSFNDGLIYNRRKTNGSWSDWESR